MSDRKVSISVSRDGGYTWGAWREISLGELGQYRHRVVARRLGLGRQFCIRVRCTSPLNMRHYGGVAEMAAGS